MRFWRTLQPKKTGGKVPEQLLKAYQTVKGIRGGLTTVLEDWIPSGLPWMGTGGQKIGFRPILFQSASLIS